MGLLWVWRQAGKTKIENRQQIIAVLKFPMAPYTGVGNYKGVWWMPRLMKGDEGRGVAAIRFGEVPSNLRSGDVRMGKPTGKKFSVFCSNAESKPWEVKHLSTKRKRDQ